MLLLATLIVSAAEFFVRSSFAVCLFCSRGPWTVDRMVKRWP